MQEVRKEMWCDRCGYDWRGDIDAYERCPKCGKKALVNRYITCPCGTTVYLDDNTNECEGCGELYNLFGQHLKPRNEWEEY